MNSKLFSNADFTIYHKTQIALQIDASIFENVWIKNINDVYDSTLKVFCFQKLRIAQEAHKVTEIHKSNLIFRLQ